MLLKHLNAFECLTGFCCAKVALTLGQAGRQLIVHGLKYSAGWPSWGRHGQSSSKGCLNDVPILPCLLDPLHSGLDSLAAFDPKTCKTSLSIKLVQQVQAISQPTARATAMDRDRALCTSMGAVMSHSGIVGHPVAPVSA